MPEKLDPITVEQKHLKPISKKPFYKEYEKRIIAWSIFWEGTINLGKDKDGSFTPNLGISNTDFEGLENFKKIVKLGRISKVEYRKNPRAKPQKLWNIRNYRGITFILQRISQFLPSEKDRKLAALLLEFCQIRIHKHDSNLDLSYGKREHEIYREMKKLNRKGR